MIRVRSLTAGVVVAGLLASGAAFAQGPRGGGRAGGPAGRMPLGSLELTQAQQDLIRDIRQRHAEEARQTQSKLRELQQAQRKAIDAIPLDEAQIRAATLALAEAQAELAVQQARVQNEIFAALTPAQQEELRKARAERNERQAQREAEMRQRMQERQQRRLQNRQ